MFIPMFKSVAKGNWGAMRCISCCGEMRVVLVDQDPGMAGYEHQTLECSGCNKTERRLAFTGDKAFWPAEYWRTSIAIDAPPALLARTDEFECRRGMVAMKLPRRQFQH